VSQKLGPKFKAVYENTNQKSGPVLMGSEDKMDDFLMSYCQ